MKDTSRTEEIKSRIKEHDTSDVKNLTKNLAKNIADIIKEFGLATDSIDKVAWDIAKTIKDKKPSFTKNDIMEIIEQELLKTKKAASKDVVLDSDHMLVINDTSKSKNQKIRELTDKGLSVGSIAKALNLHYQRVRNIAKIV